jgi:hypothetical protein
MVKPPLQIITSAPRRRPATRTPTGLKQQNCALKTALAKRGSKPSAGKTGSNHSKINV